MPIDKGIKMEKHLEQLNAMMRLFWRKLASGVSPDDLPYIIKFACEDTVAIQEIDSMPEGHVCFEAYDQLRS